MQIKDVNTSELLPDFAHQIDWVCDALDAVLKSIRRKTDAMDAPLTMSSIEALSDEEIQYYFSQIGVISYYPDIPRNIQNEILYNLARLQTRLGTPRAVELLCQYVFKDIDLFIEIFDNLAFNSLGELVDESLIDLFDVTVHPSTNSLEQDFITRLYKSIFSLSRNSQTIRNLNIQYQDNNIDLGACIALPYDDIEGVEYVYNYDLCESVIVEEHLYFGGDFSGNSIKMESVDGGGGLIEKFASYKALFELRGWEPGGLFIDKPRMMGICGVLTETSDSVVLVEVPKQLSVGRIEFTGSLAEGGIPESGVVEEYDDNVLEMDFGYYSYNGTSFEPVTLHSNDYGVAGILTQQNSDRLENFGLSVSTTTNGSGPNGCVAIIESFYHSFVQELLEIYENIVNNKGANPVTFDPSNFRLEVDNNVLFIKNTDAFATPVSAWRCRFTRIEHETEYIEVLLGLRWRSDHWGAESFDYGSGNYWYGGIMSQEDQQRLIDFGCTIIDEGSDTKGTYGTISYSSDFAYEVIDVYSDVQGTISNGFDMSNFDIRETNGFSIWCTSSYSTLSITWRCRVVKRVPPAPALPTVTLISESYYGIDNTTSVSYINPGSSTISLRSWYGTGFMGDYFTRDANYVYALYKYSMGSGVLNPCGIFVVDWSDNLLCAKNIASNTSAFYSAMVATCNSSDATVITVLNSSDEAYNAFKFTANGTDYYYVLDDTQTDWTDDLSSIGYHLPPATT